jgi:O-antigen/teichoic acid export membrane protein
MNNKNGTTLIRNSLLNLLNTAIIMCTSWVGSIWIARQLGPSDYGIFTLVLWITNIFGWVIGMGLTHAVTKFIAEYRGRNKTEALGPIIRFVLKLEVSITVIIAGILAFLATPIADFFFSPSESFLFFLAFVGLLPGIVTSILASAVEGIQKFEYFTVANLTIAPLSLLSKIVVLLNGYGTKGLLVVMLVFSCINTVFFYLVLRREGIRLWQPGTKLPAELVKRIRHYNFSVMAILICDKVIWDKSENFFLGRLCTAAETGFYNLGYNVSQRLTTILPTTFWRVLFPTMSSYFGSGNKEKMRRLFFLSTRYLAFVSFPVGVGGAILAYPLLHFLYGHDFVGAQRPLQIMFLASMLTSLSNPGAAILYGYEKQSFIYKLGGIMALVNIGLDILLIRRFGAVGAATAYAFTTVVGSTIGTIYTCTIMKLPYPFLSMFKILFATIIMGIVMELIILQAPGVVGFAVAIGAGAFVYLVSALVLGTFEEEDYRLLESARVAFPGKTKKGIDAMLAFVSQFKQR